MVKKDNLDFIVVGIQKSGTTMLSSYLSSSKEIFIPKEKEIPFFLDESLQRNGWNDFIYKYFKYANNNQLWGTVTPQYLMYPSSLSKIYKKFPKIKIIVIYRDPIKRLMSHFDMTKRFHKESRDINAVISDQLKNINKLRNSPYNSPLDKFLSSGEYFRLNQYLKIFPNKNILRLDFQELKIKPENIVKKLSLFLNVSDIDKYNMKVKMPGGNKKLINIDHNKIFKILKFFLIKVGIYNFLSEQILRIPYLISYWIDQNNVNTKSKTNIKDIHEDKIKLLEKHYEEDILIYREFFKK